MALGNQSGALVGLDLLDDKDYYMSLKDKDGQLLALETGFPFIHSEAYKTAKGTAYLKAPGIHLIAKPQTRLDSVTEFLGGFDKELGFQDYLNDPVKLDDGAALVKFAGQSCYASFGPKRSQNKDAKRYFDNIKESKHGSVVEHAAYSMFVYGVSRSLTHELVRHRSGWGFSQLSQRFVSGSILRFVERPEYQNDAELHGMFEESIDKVANAYDVLANKLLERQLAGDKSLSAERKTDLRKKVQQTARSRLPNEAETFLVVTGNVRAWRHACEMRASEHADVEIRELFMRAYRILSAVEPLLFDDYKVEKLSDGTEALSTPFPKI